MGVPATTGVLRTEIVDMKIGDYIAWGYNGSIYTLNTTGLSEHPITGSPAITGFWYGIKVAKGLIIADRVPRHTMTWDAINTAKIVQGLPLTLGTTNGAMRSLTGGVAYADANGNMSLTDKGLGAFPANNEWDKYIIKFPSDKIKSGKTSDDVWHWSSCRTWCQDTPANNTFNPQNSFQAINGQRVVRGKYQNETNSLFNFNTSSASTSDMGFRPVFEYKEV